MFLKYRRKRRFTFKVCVFIVILTSLIFVINFQQNYNIILISFIQNTRNESYIYEQSLQMYESGIIPNFGCNGKVAYFEDPVERGLAEHSLRTHGVASTLSDRIPLNRTLPDPRNPGCKKFTYNPRLTASVVIILHNEVFSILLRTIWSVILQTPKHLLHEIVMVDDASTQEKMKGLLQYYIDTRLNKYNIKLLRLSDRKGIVTARLAGAKVATGDVLIFLDAHCECTNEWIEPLLSRIEEDRTVVCVPIIDLINASNMEYQYGGKLQMGGFSWEGHYTLIDIQDKNDQDRLTPIKTPTMAGGLLGIERKYFWEVGAYDDEMYGWGGENLEISFRVWMCGGRLEAVPCSRVGHIYKLFHAYESQLNAFPINIARLAHVWMDEYKRLHFIHEARFMNSPLLGNLTKRRALRKRLKCKSFKWFLENVYPEKFIPDENVVAYGQARNKFNMCLDGLGLRQFEIGDLGLRYCHPRLEPSQLFSVTYTGELRNEYLCAKFDGNSKVFLNPCHEEESKQFWIYFKNGTIYNSSFKRCLSSESVSVGLKSRTKTLTIDVCENNDHQTWTFSNVNSTAFV